MNSRTPNNVINEQLSAFLDGELSQAELPLLLRQLEKQPELLSEAQRLQQAHLCVLGEQPVQALSQAASFCQNVHAAIAREVAISGRSDYPNKISAYATSQQSVDRNRAATQPKAQPIGMAANDSFWKGLAGAGIAAAVAMLAVNLWQVPNINDPALDAGALSAVNLSTPVSEGPAETYTVPKYIAPNQTDSTTFFLDPDDFQTVSLDERRTSSLDRFNYDYSDELLRNRTILLRMHQAESLSEQLLQENARLKQRLDSQAILLKATDLTE